MIAIVRRRLKGQKISEADREHLHHILMIKMHLGHRRTVITLYIVTALFAVAAITSYLNPRIGLWMVLVLIILADLFIEYTGMINPKFHPVLNVINRIFGWPKMKDGTDPVDTMNEEEGEKEK